MLFQTYGEKCKPAVLFFHAMGVTGASSEPVAKHLQSRCFCILPTSTVYCAGQTYRGKADEVRQVEDFLTAQGISELALVVASSIGADLAMAFLKQTKRPVGHVFFDGGQFAQIGCATRHILTPFLYLAIKSLYWSRGGTLKKIMWCDDDGIKPYFMAAGKKSALWQSAPSNNGQLGGQAVSADAGGLAEARFLRVRQHRGAHEVPSGGHAGVSGGEFPDFCGLQPHTIPDSRPERLCGHADKHHGRGQTA